MRELKRALLAVLCALTLCAGLAALAGCSSGDSAQEPAEEPAASGETVMFTDSVGREVELPAQIDRICPSGFTAQQVLLTMAPDKMVGLAEELTEDQLKIFGSELAELPILGAVLGSSDTMNREAVAAADPQVIIDTGEAKKNVKEDLDALQEQLGIPVIFIESSLKDFGGAYRTLGEILGMQERGNEIADYLDGAYKTVEDTMATIPEDERVKMAYLLGKNGLNAIAKTSFQGQIVDMVADNVVVVDDVTGKGTGNEISLEQIAVWNPELIVFQAGSIYDTVGDDAAWQGIAAIADDNYYECPNMPWCWLNNPPTVNMMMGLQWLPRLLYPDKFDDSIADVTKVYYETMYNYELSDAELEELLAHATPKTAA